MYISQETPAQTHVRLQQVMTQTQLVIYESPYAFVEAPVESFPVKLSATALALVRDEQVWSALVPSDDSANERFLVFRFHFPEGVDNSGFVGWLATHLKTTLGIGVFVVCGQNSTCGGIFDYWGAPMAASDAVIAELHKLRGG